MTDYTPTTGTVLSCFLDGAAGEFITDDFHRWLASMKAETLRAAADQFVHDWTEVALGGATYVASALRDRADHIEREADSE